MLKKSLAAALFVATAFVGLPGAAAANPDDACMLHNGCFWASGDGSDAGHWVCSNPAVYMLCLSPDGLTASTLTFDPLTED